MRQLNKALGTIETVRELKDEIEKDIDALPLPHISQLLKKGKSHLGMHLSCTRTK